MSVYSSPQETDDEGFSITQKCKRTGTKQCWQILHSQIEDVQHTSTLRLLMFDIPLSAWCTSTKTALQMFEQTQRNRALIEMHLLISFLAFQPKMDSWDFGEKTFIIHLVLSLRPNSLIFLVLPCVMAAADRQTDSVETVDSDCLFTSSFNPFISSCISEMNSKKKWSNSHWHLTFLLCWTLSALFGFSWWLSIHLCKCTERSVNANRLAFALTHTHSFTLPFMSAMKCVCALVFPM